MKNIYIYIYILKFVVLGLLFVCLIIGKYSMLEYSSSKDMEIRERKSETQRKLI